MVERTDVDELHGDTCIDDTSVVGGAELAGNLREEWPESLASCEKEVLRDLREEGIVRDGHLGESLLDASHPIPHGGDRYELLEAGCVHPHAW